MEAVLLTIWASRHYRYIYTIIHLSPCDLLISLRSLVTVSYSRSRSSSSSTLLSYSFPQVQARDLDASSELRYTIIDPDDSPFWIDSLTGKLGVKPDASVQMESDDNHIVLTIMVSAHKWHNNNNEAQREVACDLPVKKLIHKWDGIIMIHPDVSQWRQRALRRFCFPAQSLATLAVPPTFTF